jgi:hypothetical protein
LLLGIALLTSKLNTPLEFTHENQAGKRSAFLVNVVEATLANRHGSVNIGEFKKWFSRRKKIAQHSYEEGHRVSWDKVRI